jgi:hypothetical protein
VCERVTVPIYTAVRWVRGSHFATITSIDRIICTDPFYPSPPFPTFALSEYHPEFPNEALFAPPISEVVYAGGILVEHPDPYKGFRGNMIYFQKLAIDIFRSIIHIIAISLKQPTPPIEAYYIYNSLLIGGVGGYRIL